MLRQATDGADIETTLEELHRQIGNFDFAAAADTVDVMLSPT
ncbi:MAG: hypothetical protein O2782_16180 [bacterium]|nr:hypothetical protein [bacterium]